MAVLLIVLPVFGLILAGFGAARAGWFDAAATRGLSIFVFNFALPVQLCRSVARADLSGAFAVDLLLSYYIPALVVMAAGAMVARQSGKRGGSPGIYGLGAAFSNMVILGLPIVVPALGPESAPVLLSLLAVHSLTLFTIATLVIELGRVGPAAEGVPVWKRAATVLRASLAGLFTNPLIIGISSGLALNIAGLPLTGVIDAVAEMLAQAATPGALFAMGASLARLLLPGALKPALALATLKLLVQPVLVWLLATQVFGLSELATHTAVLAAAMPIGVNMYLFAVRYAAEEATAAIAVVLSTAGSIVTLSTLIVLFRP